LKKKICYTGLVIGLFACAPGIKTPEERAKIIHEKVLTVDSHADTPWYLLQGGFDLAKRHDFEKEHSRVDFVRMKEGGLDAVFLAAFVGQRKRDEEGNKNAKDIVVATIDSIHSHISTDINRRYCADFDDAYRLEKGKRIAFIGIEMLCHW
jgi:membrane dipeptidase